MKKLISLLCLAALMLLAACSVDAEEKKTSTKEKTIIVEGLQLDLTKQQVTPSLSKDKKEQKVYLFTITGKNLSTMKKGLGSADFVLKTKDGKQLAPDYHLASFGSEIQPNKSLTGNISFTLKKDQQADKLIYQLNNKDITSWKAKN